MFIIPEKVLNKLICSVCSKYLSVKPVKVYRSRVVKCGRCSSNDNDDGVVSLYNNIIENGLFPCINRYEGCNQLMNSSEVAAHEEFCLSRTYKCPICLSKNEHTSYQLFQHYKNVHPDKILEIPQIISNGEKEFENYYLYQENNFIFIIYLRCDTLENCFLFNVACLGPRERVENIVQDVKCYLYDDKNSERLFFQSKSRRCSIFENNAITLKIAFPNKMNFVTLNFSLDESDLDNFNYIKPNKSDTSGTISVNNKTENFGLRNKYPKIYLSDEYKKKYPEHSLSPCKTKLFGSGNELFPRVCHFCENIFQKSCSFRIFKCSCDHFYCSDCYDIDPYCFKSRNLSPFERSYDELLRFYCRWNCGASFAGKFLIRHEDTCRENCDAQYSLKFLAEKYFSSYLSNTVNCFILNTNVFCFRDYDFLDKQEQQVFVITRENVKFLLNIKCVDGKLSFPVFHNYPSDKYYFLFKLKGDKTEISLFNTFAIPEELISADKTKNVGGFAVVLKKILDE